VLQTFTFTYRVSWCGIPLYLLSLKILSPKVWWSNALRCEKYCILYDGLMENIFVYQYYKLHAQEWSILLYHFILWFAMLVLTRYIYTSVLYFQNGDYFLNIEKTIIRIRVREVKWMPRRTKIGRAVIKIRSQNIIVQWNSGSPILHERNSTSHRTYIDL
jgi:hypothetical protein